MVKFTFFHIKRIKMAVGEVSVEDFAAKCDELAINPTGKMHRNSSRLIETVVSFSPEFYESWKYNPKKKTKINTFFNALEKYLKEQYGEIAIFRNWQFDEKTPHLHFLLAPIPVTNNRSTKC